MKIRTGIGIAATVLTAALALGGCSNGGTAAPAANGSVGGTLTGVFDGAYKASLEPTVQAFQKKYPGVKVEINYAGGDVGGLISTQLQAGTAPDLLLTFPGGSPGNGGNVNVVTMASQNRLLDLSDSSWASAVPKKWSADVTYQGKTYAYPGAVQGLGAVYNQTKLDELKLSIPQTISQVLDLCAAAKRAGIYAYAQGLGDVSAGPQMLSFAQTGTLVYGPNPEFTQQQVDGKATFQDSAWRQQFELYKKMYDAGCFGEGALGRTRQQGGDAVAAGRALGIVDVGAVMGTMQKTAPRTKFALAAMPATDNPTDTYMPALPGYTLAVNAKAKNPATAKAFLEFLAQPENINQYAAEFGSIPAIPNSEFKPPAQLAEFAKLVASDKFSNLPTWPNPVVQTTLNKVVQSMLLGDDSPESALKKMQDTLAG
jgi:raffinose/stachyose/melibiose transport system substrate-binding protein